MKTRRQACLWLYRDVVAFSLRKKAARLQASDIGPDITAAGVKRCRLEMERLALWLERKAARIEARIQPEKETT